MLSILFSMFLFGFLFKFLAIPILLSLFACRRYSSGSLRSFWQQLLRQMQGQMYNQSTYYSWFDQQQGQRSHQSQQQSYQHSQQQNQQRRQQQSGTMTRSEALEILGLQSNATPGQIKAAYQKLIKAVHPDTGGSAYLTQKLNQAKEFLLD